MDCVIGTRSLSRKSVAARYNSGMDDSRLVRERAPGISPRARAARSGTQGRARSRRADRALRIAAVCRLRGRGLRELLTRPADEALVPPRQAGAGRRSSSSTRSTARSSTSRCSAGPTSARRSRLRPPVSLSVVKVVLPDNSELELPDGASGLDAARRDRAEARRAGRARPRRTAIARPAAAARGRRADPDPDDARQGRPRRALRAAPLDRAPAGRGGAPALPGREDRDRPADRERLLLRLRVSRSRSTRPTSSGSRTRSAAS